MKNRNKGLFKEALVESWIAWGAGTAYLAIRLTGGNAVAAGACLIVAAVLGMNGYGKSDLWLTAKGPRFWRHHPVLQWVHHRINEGEIAGILIGVTALGVIITIVGHVHLPYNEGFTLLGIMSLATVAASHVRPIIGLIERIGGRIVAIVVGSLIGSFTGEPAAAVFLTESFGPRVNNRPKAAVGLAATIGSGGGLMPFAAPPILIIWPTLTREFHWDLVLLAKYVGVGCVLHVVLSSLAFYRTITPTKKEESLPKFDRASIPVLLGLASLVTLHSKFHDVWWLWILDTAAAVLNWVVAHKRFQGKDKAEAEATAKWKPLTLAALLIALDLIGLEARPFITWIASRIPADLHPIALSYALFFVTAWVSHVADNALASRVFIVVAIAFAPTLGPMAAVLVVAIISGALFGGFLTIPANLPNFYIAGVFRVGAGEWLGTSWKLYPTVVAYLGWITVLYLYLSQAS